MLLNEILQKQVNAIKQSKKPISDIMYTDTHDVLGVGGFAIAYLHKKFPDKVIKTIQINGTSDPSYQFLRLVLKHQDNPYFPKIFSVKMYPTKIIGYQVRSDEFEKIDDEYGTFSPPPSQMSYTLYVVTEKLQPLNASITRDDLVRFGIEDFPIPARMRNYKRQNAIKFRLAFKDVDFRQYMQQIVKDPQLKQALRLLEPLFRHYEPDMHDGNIMLRGDHWVFVDPITHDE